MTSMLARSVPVLLGLSATVAAQGGWVQVSTNAPGARHSHAMAYDSVRGRVVLFGGEDVVGNNLADTWEWDGTTWLQVATTGPSARFGHAMAFDSVRGKVVLFGGYYLFADTWEWDGLSWTQAAASGPQARAWPAMAFDGVRGATVLFGGTGAGGPLGDAWAWNGTQWNAVAYGPGTTANPLMAFDSARNVTVAAFGTSSMNPTQTWEWNGINWTPAASIGPSFRVRSAMAFDSHRGRGVLFGGYRGAVIAPFLADTWEWSGTSWLQMNPSTPFPAPPARAGHAMAYDAQHDRTVIFGGYFYTTATGGTIDPGSYVVRGDTWTYTGAPGTGTPYGSGCGSPALSLSQPTNALPTIGASAQALLTNVPSSFAFVAVGWSNTHAGPFLLPVPLDGYGMTGCFMRQSTEVLAEPTTSTGTGTASYSLALPYWSSLIGMHLYLQGWAVAPGMNAANIIVSNGLDWRVGF